MHQISSLKGKAMAEIYIIWFEKSLRVKKKIFSVVSDDFKLISYSMTYFGILSLPQIIKS